MSDLKPKLNEDGSLLNVMPKVNGKPFECSCGCNVFHHQDENCLSMYECNGCGEWYRGTEAKTQQRVRG